MTTSLLRRVHQRLDDAAIPHALIGAAALAIHGVSRSTFDHDLLVTDRRALTDAIWAELVAEARVDLRHGGDDDPLAGVVRVTAAGERDVDVVVGRYEWQTSLIERATLHDTPAGPMTVVQPDGLVLLKLYAGGPQDMWDIEQLRAALGPALDLAVDRHVSSLPGQAREAWLRLRG